MGLAPSYYDSIGLLAICDAIDAVEGIPFRPEGAARWAPSESPRAPLCLLSGPRHADPGMFAPPQHILLAHIPVTGVLSPFGTIPYEEQTRMAMSQLASAGQIPQQPPAHIIGGARPNIPVAHNLNGTGGQRSRSASVPQGGNTPQGGTCLPTSASNAPSTGNSTFSKPDSPAAVQPPPLARPGLPHQTLPNSPPAGINTPGIYGITHSGASPSDFRGNDPSGMPASAMLASAPPASGMQTPGIPFGVHGSEAPQSETQGTHQTRSPQPSSTYQAGGVLAGSPHADQVNFGPGGAHMNSNTSFAGNSYEMSAPSAISPGMSPRMSPGSLAGVPHPMPPAAGLGNMPGLAMGNLGGMSDINGPPVMDSRASTPGSPLDSSQSQFRVEVCQICGRDFKGRKAATHKQQHIRRLHPAEYTPKRGGKKSRSE